MAWPDGEHLSAPALSRLDALGQLISQLRTRTGSALADLLAEAEVALGLDVEVLSRPGWHPGAAGPTLMPSRRWRHLRCHLGSPILGASCVARRRSR